MKYSVTMLKNVASLCAKPDGSIRYSPLSMCGNVYTLMSAYTKILEDTQK